MVILNLLENAERGKGTTRGGASLRLDAANLRSEAGLPILSAFEVPGGGRSMRNSASQLPYLPSPTKTRARGDSEEPQQPDIHEFLEVLGLTKYLPLFEKEEVDFETLVTMTETDLKGIGLSLFGPRRKISSAIKCWQEEQQAEDDQEVDLLVSELQCSFEARVSEEMKMLTDKVNDLSTSLTESQVMEQQKSCNCAHLRLPFNTGGRIANTRANLSFVFVVPFVFVVVCVYVCVCVPFVFVCARARVCVCVVCARRARACVLGPPQPSR